MKSKNFQKSMNKVFGKKRANAIERVFLALLSPNYRKLRKKLKLGVWKDESFLLPITPRGSKLYYIDTDGHLRAK